MDQGARMIGHVAPPDRSPGRPIEPVEAADAGPAQDAIHGRAGMTRQRPDPVRSPLAIRPGMEDRLDVRAGQGPRRSMRPRAPVLEPGPAFLPEPAQPLVRGAPADLELAGHLSGRPTLDRDPIHQDLPAEDGQPRRTMCHESLSSVWCLNTSTPWSGLSLCQQPWWERQDRLIQG